MLLTTAVASIPLSCKRLSAVARRLRRSVAPVGGARHTGGDAQRFRPIKANLSPAIRQRDGGRRGGRALAGFVERRHQVQGTPANAPAGRRMPGRRCGRSSCQLRLPTAPTTIPMPTGSILPNIRAPRRTVYRLTHYLSSREFSRDSDDSGNAAMASESQPPLARRGRTIGRPRACCRRRPTPRAPGPGVVPGGRRECRTPPRWPARRQRWPRGRTPFPRRPQTSPSTSRSRGMVAAEPTAHRWPSTRPSSAFPAW